MRKLYRNFKWGYNGEPQSMLVEDNRVLERGRNIEGVGAEEEDLSGAYVLPSFVDAHCHILPTGLDLQKLHLGSCRSHDQILDAVRDRHQKHPEGWLLAVHYDQNNFADGIHLSRDQLDSISSERPILLRHTNGHASVANSAALQLAGVDEETQDPQGGTYVRDSSGRLTGLLLEHAHEHVSDAYPMPSEDEMVQAILKAGDSMRSFGICCASDMMTGYMDLRQELNAYRRAVEQGCKIDVRLYLQWKEVFGPKGCGAGFVEQFNRTAPSGLRISGIKIFADGAIASATAAIYGQFLGGATGPKISRHGRRASHEEREVDGQLMYSPERLTHMVRTASEAGFQVSVHSIGDYSTDLVLNAFEATGEPSRHRIEHAMLLGDQQIERMAKLGCYCTFQPEFIMRLGNAYKRQLGPERASRIKRSRSVIDAGIRLSFNSDRPIVAGDPMDGIRTAVSRPDGFDAAEDCTPEEAFRAYTVEGSRVNGDEDLYGTLDPGSSADFQICRSNPMQL